MQTLQQCNNNAKRFYTALCYINFAEHYIIVVSKIDRKLNSDIVNFNNANGLQENNDKAETAPVELQSSVSLAMTSQV
jgi:hypothetical protein